jgi:hypothetical protein
MIIQPSIVRPPSLSPSTAFVTMRFAQSHTKHAPLVTFFCSWRQDRLFVRFGSHCGCAERLDEAPMISYRPFKSTFAGKGKERTLTFASHRDKPPYRTVSAS